MTTDELRKEARRRLGACPTCGRGITSAATEAIGLPYHTIQRFLRGDNVAPDALAAFATWLEAAHRAER